LDKKKKDEMQLRFLLSAVESEPERVVDAYGGPLRKMRQKICRLKLTIRGLSQQHDNILNDHDDDSGDCATNLDSDGSNDSEFEEGNATPVQRKHPKLDTLQEKKPERMRLAMRLGNTSKGSTRSSRMESTTYSTTFSPRLLKRLLQGRQRVTAEARKH
jgi:hypothetical protein